MHQRIHTAGLVITAMLLMSLIPACKPSEQLNTVRDVDLQRYAGTWYEIARLPNRFEKGLDCVSATYTLQENGRISVLNQGRKSGGKFKDIQGTAWVPDPDTPGKLKVRFFWPFAGDYQILVLDKDYTYALVGDPSRKFLWILSRSRQLNPSVIDLLKNHARSQGFNPEEMIMVNQDCTD